MTTPGDSDRTPAVPAHERLLDLVIALTQARPMMTKAQIRTQVRGYADSRPGDARSAARVQEAFDRKFDRDKETLRQLGIPLLTLTSSVHSDEVGYRIDLDDYALPRVELTAAELGVLGLAAQAWQDSTLARSARRALTKLRAITPRSAVDDAIGAVGLGAGTRGLLASDEPLGDLFAAITDRTAVRFTYHAARTGTSSVRHVEPWRLVARERGWYLVGWDRDRRARRTFRLSRIEGAISPVDGEEPFQLPETDAYEGTAEPTLLQAEVAVRSDRAPRLRAAGRPKGRVTVADGDELDVLVIEVADREAFASEIAGYGEAVVVLSPPDLRAAVLRRLAAVAALDPTGSPT